jgi:tetratricopeptide (TPR) repeat protein
MALAVGGGYRVAAEENPTERGDAAMRAGNYTEAVQIYAEAIDREPQKADHYLDRSAAHDMAGETDQALADANKAIELEPKNAMAYDVRGWVKYTKRPNADAIADLTKALELNPKSARALNRRARILTDENRFNEALSAQRQEWNSPGARMPPSTQSRA